MKKNVFFAAIFFAAVSLFSACGGSTERSNAESDSLRGALANSLANIDDMNLFLDAVNVSLDSVVNMEGGILRTVGESPKSTREQIKDNIVAFKMILARQHERIAELEARLKKGDAKNEKLLKTISALKQQLEEKDQAIVELTEELERRNYDIQTLKAHVERLNTSVAQLNEEKKEQEVALERQSDMMNEAYVIICTKKELKDAGVLSGGSLLKKSKLDVSKISSESCKKIDIRKVKTFTIPAKKFEILSQIPAGSYTTIKNDDGTVTLNVTDATLFWSVSNYLIIKY
ncbi:MAG: hypothetical protein ACI4B3_12215 [Prevotella sp.]